MFRHLVLAMALCAPTLAPASTLEQWFTEVVVFGDSLADPVNPSLPLAFYPNAQHTNGDTWAVQLGLDDPAANNFAESSATAKSDGPGDFQGQIDDFTALGKTLGNNALAMVWLGGNDIGDAVLSAAGLPRVNQALAAMASGLDNLALAGFDKAVLFLAPDIGDTPRLQAVDAFIPGAAAFATGLSAAYNAGLQTISSQMTESLTLGFVDIPGLVGDVKSDPAAFGFTNVEDACVVGFIAYVNGCSAGTANGFLYYDDFHPSERAHALVAAEALRVAGSIAPIPLPAGLLLLTSALGGLGLVARARRRAV